MPIYEYSCRKCGNRFEHLARRIGEAPPACPSCGTPKPRKEFSSFSTAGGHAAQSPCEAGACPAADRCPSAGCSSGRCPF
jgi:putative FmdB family regulatory protein